MNDFSARASAVTLRTYNRPLDESGSSFESWEQTVTRSQYDHHRKLWETAGGVPDEAEIQEVKQLGLERKSLVAGRVLWLGGTEYAYSRPCCNYNCSFTQISNVYDAVDAAWLLLNGCGVGFKPQMGTLHGYLKPIENLKLVDTKKDKDHKGPQDNLETLPNAENEWTWTIKIGDSAEAWAKALGKLFNPRARGAKSLVLDGSRCRGAGGRLKGYGWICNGVAPLLQAMAGVHEILNQKAGNLLDEIDIGDVMNWYGTILSSRRAAEIWKMDSHSPYAAEFSTAKLRYWENNLQRRQSNNSKQYWHEPSLSEIKDVLYAADECGGDPAIENAEAARNKAPWYTGSNPCNEILLGAFCNLVTNGLPRFRRNFAALERAVYLIARANYRQTCVNLDDGVLQPRWHQTNEALRLCGVSLTGIVQAGWLTDYQIRRLRYSAVYGAYSMADQLGLPRPKAVTTGKPEGTGSKCMGGGPVGEIAEGIHRPLGRHILNWINFSQHDPLVEMHRAVGYRTMPNPSDPHNVLVCFPVEYKNVAFDRVNGKEVNLESAVKQLDRYLRWNNLWADHNMSCTVSYSPEELPEMAAWMKRHWNDGFISVATLRRNDPTKTAKDLGHPYLPQEVVNEGPFREYQQSLRPVDYSRLTGGIYEIDAEEGCKGGVCPVR